MPQKRRSNTTQRTPGKSPYQQVGPGATDDFSRDSYVYRAASKKRMSRGKKVAVAVLASVMAIFIGAGSAFALYMNYINSELNKGDKTEEELSNIAEALSTDTYNTSLDEPFYMLLLGSDGRTGDEGPSRSDSNIVCRVDPISDTVSMLSIPRDTKIEIDGYGTQKFNAAYAFDGAAGAIRAAEELLDIDITHYAEVNFSALAGLVDAVGGITVENESVIDNPKCDDGDGNHYIIEEGIVTLSGGEALTFARNRDYPDGDFTRQRHQRMVIEAIVDSVLAMPITGIPAVIEAAAKCVTTDLNAFDIIGLAQRFADADDITIYSGMLPSYTQNINGISFVINDEEKTEEMMRLFKAGEDFGDIISEMTAADIVSSDYDMSNVLLFDDDDEVASGAMTPTQPVEEDTPITIPDDDDDDVPSVPSGGSSSSAGSETTTPPASSSSAGTSGGTSTSTPSTPPASSAATSAATVSDN